MIGDFNSDVSQSCMKAFCESYNLSSVIKEPACYKNPQNPSCIELILTNSHYNFQNSCLIETGLSYFHKMTVTVKKTSYKKLKPRIINYRDYENFCDDTENINANWFREILQICINTLDIYAPCTKK